MTVSSELGLGTASGSINSYKNKFMLLLELQL